MPATEMQADWLATLNDSQRCAVEHDAGPLIVLAGPGTGKTRTLIARVRRLVESGEDPASILALTFSVKAAEEMRSRLAEAVGAPVADRVHMSTFHSFGHSMVARFGDMIGLRRPPDLMDSAQLRRLLRRLLREAGLKEADFAAGLDTVAGEVRAFIVACRQAGRMPAEARRHAEEWANRLATNEAGLQGDDLEAERVSLARFERGAGIFEAFDRACVLEGAVTYDEFLSLPTRILEEQDDARAIVRSEIRHVLVDEFQDVNGAQLRLLKMLAPPEGSSGRVCDLCVVGDDDQAIYGFRGTDSMAFERFAKTWESHETIALTKNYRSADEIARTGNLLISKCQTRFDADKVLESARDLDGSVEAVAVASDQDHGPTIGAMILHDRHEHDRPWSSYGVLVRTVNEGERVAAALELEGIPVATSRKLTPLQDPGIEDLLAWMRIVLSDDEPARLQRLLARPPCYCDLNDIERWRAEWKREVTDPVEPKRAGFEAYLRERVAPEHPRVAGLLATLDWLRERSAAASADEFVNDLIERTDPVDTEGLDPRTRASRIEHVVALLRFVRAKQDRLDEPGDLRAFWSYYEDLDPEEQEFSLPREDWSDVPESDDGQPDPGNRVQVLTAHKSKGLEFDTVFVARVSAPWGFPLSRSESPDDAPLPDSFSGRVREPHLDEERRLFYVACTRAERRLVVLAKRRKGRSTTDDYYAELRDAGPELEVPEADGEQFLGENLDSGAIDEIHRRRRDCITPAIRAARRRGHAALRDAETGGADPADIEARLSRSALELRALTELRETGALPEDAQGDPDLEAVKARCESAAPLPRLTRPMPGPLQLSYSRLSDYERCPRCFYVKYVLGLDEPKTFELSIGNIVHSALERFTIELRSAESEGEPRPGVERLDAIARDEFKAAWPRSRAFDEDALKKVLGQLRLAHDNLLDDEGNILEVEADVSFRYACPLGRHEAGHMFSGKIDRLDQLPDGSFRIIDYKTGSATKRLLEPDKKDQQLCIYAMALPHFLGDPDGEIPNGVAEYWTLSTGQRGRIDLADLKLDAARKSIDAAITGMLEGRFERGSKCKGLCGILGEPEGD